MKKRTELKILAALASIASLAALCSGSEAAAQQRFKDALYESPSVVTRSEQQALDAKTDSLIAKTRRLAVFRIGRTDYQISLPADVTIRVYDDPRNFLYDHSNLSWLQIDNIFWRGPWAYYGPYGAFGPYNRSGWGYFPYSRFFPYMSSWAGWYGGPMYGFGYNGLADYPFYGGIYDLDYYEYAFSPWWWGGFHDGGFDCFCFCDPWFYGGPYHHNHVYLEGRQIPAFSEPGRTDNRLSAPRSSAVASTGRGGSSGRSGVAGTPVTGSSTGRAGVVSQSRSQAASVSRSSSPTAAPVNGLVSSSRSNASVVSRGDGTIVNRSEASRSESDAAYRRASSGRSSVSDSGSHTAVSDYSRSRSGSVFGTGTDSGSSSSSVSGYSSSSRGYSTSSSSSYSGGSSSRSSSGYSGSSSSYSGGSSSGRSSSSGSSRR